MTVVVAALNKQAVALAADSAVTVGPPDEQKIFYSANKVFQLSRAAPVGVAIYGSNEINGVPWETVIKEFREQELREKRCSGTADYAQCLLGWLDRAPFASGSEGADARAARYVRREVRREYRAIVQEAERGEGGREEVINAAERAFESLSAEQGEGVPAGYQDRLGREFAKTLEALLAESFDRFLPDDALSERLHAVALAALASAPRPGGDLTGLVCAGFGEADFLPVLVPWEVAGIAGGYCRRRSLAPQMISDGTPALLLPYAQTRDVRAVIEGVEPAYQRGVEQMIEHLASGLVKEVLDHVEELDHASRERYTRALAPSAEERVKEAAKELEGVRAEFSKPIYRTVAALPKDELATMAETLVNTTAFKRRFSSRAESVGGPVDVAVITRGDGFVWIKRKHYFQMELNPRFGVRHLQSKGE